MNKRKNGRTESNIIQAKFTVYLMKAVWNYHAKYKNIISRQKQYEVSWDLQEDWGGGLIEQDMLDGLSLLDQLENQDLVRALCMLSTRELEVVLAKVVEEKRLAEIAKSIDLGYKGAASVYSRAIKKLRYHMKGGNH